MQMNEYLSTLTEQIRCRKAHPMIEEEYRAHIEEQMEDYVRCGMEQKEAEEAAVAQMGDPVEAGVALDRVHRPKLCVSVIFAILFLTVVGIVMQAVMFADVQNEVVQNEYLMRSIIYNLIGLGVMALVCYMDYSFLYKHALGLCMAWYAVIFASVFFGVPFDYHARFTLFYHITVLFYPLYAACMFRYRNQGAAGFVKSVALALPAAFLMLQAPGATKIFEFYILMLMLFTVAFLKGWFGRKGLLKTVLMWMFAIGAPVIRILRILNAPNSAYGYRAARLKAFIHPEAYAEEAGYTAMQIRDILSGIRLSGSAQMIGDKLPNAYNDFILIGIFAYFGAIVGILVCAAFLFFFVRVFAISFKQKNQLAMMIGTACALELFLRSVIYALSDFGVCPLTQMCMPFMSYGLWSALSNAVLTGLLLSIYRYEDVLSEKQMRTFPHYRLRIKLEKADPVS
ncbi:MAG: FtsW/RodA/SpoVE family cell cycle protein [Lachnospiraceae bacterium]|nr:FtsW/RodA/SpoVE family cell cycle protein [Lachnospiraceae bacterium]